MSKFASLLTTLILAISSSAQASLFGPSNFEDCVLRGLKDAKTDTAVSVLYDICRDKFSKDVDRQTTLLDRESAHLLCEASGLSPFPAYFNRSTKTFFFNNKKLEIQGQTSDKIFAKGFENNVVLNLRSGLISLTYQGRTSELSCSLAKFR